MTVTHEKPDGARVGARRRQFALFDDALRPFFLGAGVYAVLAVALWAAALNWGVAPSRFLTGAIWHGHELLFGYGAAALSGFLLTAAPGWAGRRPLRPAHLAALAALWLAGRVAANLSPRADPVSMAIVMAHLPALFVVLSAYVLRADRRNLIFLPLLLLLVVAQGLVVWSARIGDAALAGRGLLLAIDVFALLIVLLGGRVVPAFTRNAFARENRGAVPAGPPVLAVAAIGMTALVVIADQALPPAIAGWFSVAAGGAVAARMIPWRTGATLDTPLLWVLHLGYGWLAVGLLWKGVWTALALGGPGDSVHALTIGAIGTMTLAIMSRAALGHTGHALIAPRLTVCAYGLVSVAAIARLAATIVDGGAYLVLLNVSALAWCLAFALFVADYAAILVRPRGG